MDSDVEDVELEICLSFFSKCGFAGPARFPVYFYSHLSRSNEGRKPRRQRVTQIRRPPGGLYLEPVDLQRRTMGHGFLLSQCSKREVGPGDLLGSHPSVFVEVEDILLGILHGGRINLEASAQTETGRFEPKAELA